MMMDTVDASRFGRERGDQEEGGRPWRNGDRAGYAAGLRYYRGERQDNEQDEGYRGVRRYVTDRPRYGEQRQRQYGDDLHRNEARSE